jgi:hypothetical protein
MKNECEFLRFFASAHLERSQWLSSHCENVCCYKCKSHNNLKRKKISSAKDDVKSA